MKFFVFLTILSVICVLDSVLATASLIKSFSKSCQTKENASDDDVDNLASGIAPKTPEGKCLTACMGADYSVIKDNKLNKSGFMSVVGMVISDPDLKSTAGEIADECLEATDEDRCEAAAKIWECIEKEMTARGVKLF